MSLQERVALVTGAGRGVGAGIASVLAQKGATVAVSDLHLDRAQAVADEITRGGGRAHPVGLDVTDLSQIADTIAAVQADLGPLDIFVNNAGIPEARRTILFKESDPRRDWDPFINLNVYGLLHCLRAVVPGMCERKRGRLILISSGSGARGLPAGQAIYGGSKAFGDGMMRHLALELAEEGVTINAIAVGMMSNIKDHVDEDYAEQAAQSVPMKRLGEPDEMGNAVAFLASDDASYITGQVIHVNGGAYQGR